jgi:energy-coupling factor transport system permease protein
MSQFEYLRRVSIGQYLPLDSPIHRLDPRAKIIGFSFLIIAISISNNLYNLTLALLVSLILIAASRIPFSFAIQGLLPPLPFLVLIALLQLVITPHPETSSVVFGVWRITIYIEGILAALILLLRFASLLLILTTLTSSLSTIEMINGLDLLLKPLHQIGVPTKNAALLVQLTLRFIPFLALNAEKIAKSQASRGAKWDTPNGNLINRVQQIVPLVIPLFITSLRQAENLSTAMLARGFASSTARTSMHTYRFSLRDSVLLLFLLITAAGILFLF